MAHHKHSASMMVPKSEWTPAQKRHVAVQSKKIDALRKREQKMDERHQSYLKRQSEGKLTKKDFISPQHWEDYKSKRKHSKKDLESANKHMQEHMR